MLSFNPSFSDLEIYTSSDVHSTQNYNDPTPAIIEVENISSQTKANPTELVSSVEVIEGELQSLVSSIRKLSKKIFNSLQENVSKLIQTPNTTHQSEHLIRDCSKLSSSIRQQNEEMERGFFSIDLND